MPLSTATPNVLQDPGFLFWAPLATAEPAHAVVGSTFTADVVTGPPVSWTANWVPLGATEDGSEFTYETKIEPVSVAELFDPIRYSTTERSGNIGFNLANFTLTNLARVSNAGGVGSSSLTTVSGATTTLSSKYTPVTPGNEIRCMIGWESLDHTVRLVCYQCINGGSVKMTNKRAPAYATLATVFSLEMPIATGIPFAVYAAGVTRLGS